MAVGTIAFIGRLVYGRARGNRQSPAKLWLLATSIVFWWYSDVLVSNMLVGIALFEVFHDIQYLTIVWIFNLNRVDRNPRDVAAQCLKLQRNFFQPFAKFLDASADHWVFAQRRVYQFAHGHPCKLRQVHHSHGNRGRPVSVEFFPRQP